MLLGPLLRRTTFEIIFDNNPDRQYYGGQKISGQVRLTLHKEHTLCGIFIQILGKAYCHWSEGFGDVVTKYTGEEIFISDKQYVAGSDTGQTIYEPAEYTYPFDWDLPAELPTSFEGKYGYIRYNIVAGLDRPLRKEKSYTELFTVMKQVDLNEMPDLNKPLELEDVSELSTCCMLCCCFWSSSLIVKGSLVVGGYVPFETISIDLRLVNNSNIPVKSVTCKFVQTITYRPNKKNSVYNEKVDTVTLVEQACNGCAANSVQEQHIDTFVPAGVLPTETSSDVCMLQYALVFTGSGCHVNPFLTIPIIVGTVPLNRAFPSIYTAFPVDSYQPNE